MKSVFVGLFLILIPTSSLHAQVDPPSYQPSTNWWKSASFCYQGIVAKRNMAVQARNDNGTCHIAVIQKTVNGKLNTYADWINDGQAGMGRSAADDVAVAVVGKNHFDVVYLYGIRADGNVVIAYPAREHGKGKRQADYVEHDKILIRGDGKPGTPLRLYCWTGTDWLEGDNPNSCNNLHHSNLVALRAPGESFRIVRPEYMGP